ncbi:MAG: hypothetical protein AAF933_12395 [Pseudomonadota bacterium]
MSFQSVIPPKQPTTGDGWQYRCQAPAAVLGGYEGHYWTYLQPCGDVLVVISSLEVARENHELEGRPYYHLSLSKRTRQSPNVAMRASRNEARFVRKAFDMLDAEEDNHVPSGMVRNYWLPVAENLIGKECPCKDEEPAIVEDKGEYVWRGIS